MFMYQYELDNMEKKFRIIREDKKEKQNITTSKIALPELQTTRAQASNKGYLHSNNNFF